MQDQRRLESISENFRVVAWCCSGCDWRKAADNPQQSTALTMTLFQAHNCDDYKVAAKPPKPSSGKPPLVFSMLPCFG
jgi:hypothetical protein